MFRRFISFMKADTRGRRSKNACIGGGIILFFLVLAVFAPSIAPYPANEIRLYEKSQPPTSLKHIPGIDRTMRSLLHRTTRRNWVSLYRPYRTHILGTDGTGRDLFSRIVFGSRTSLRIGLVSVSIALVIGTFFGILAGYPGGWYDMIVMRLMDVFMAFPAILLAIVIVTILGPSLTNLMIAIGLVTVPQYARLVRGQVLKLRQQEFVTAARALGVPNIRIVTRYILPNCLPVLVVQSTFSIATAILDAAGLSFLGLGPEPSHPEWGAMLADGMELFLTGPWVLGFTGLAIFLVVIALNLLGDGLRDMLDPKLRRL